MGWTLPQSALPAAAPCMSCPDFNLPTQRATQSSGDPGGAAVGASPGLGEVCQVASEESGLRDRVPAGRTRGLESSAPMVPLWTHLRVWAGRACQCRSWGPKGPGFLPLRQGRGEGPRKRVGWGPAASQMRQGVGSRQGSTIISISV